MKYPCELPLLNIVRIICLKNIFQNISLTIFIMHFVAPAVTEFASLNIHNLTDLHLTFFIYT